MSKRSPILLAILAALLLAACGAPAAPPAQTSGAPGDTTLAPVELVYIYPGSVPKDLAAVQDAMNAILQPKINATIKLVATDWGAFDEKMRLMNAAGEPYDIAFTAPWTNSYYQNVANGNFAALDELLPRYAPGLWASMPESTWEAARVQGKIYGVINQQIFASSWGPYVRKDLAEKYGLDLDAVQTIEDLEPFLQAVKEGEPGVTPLYSDDQYTGGLQTMAGIFDSVDGGLGVAGIRVDAPELKVVLLPETPEALQVAELQRAWYEAGYYTSDPIPAAEGQAALKAGKYAAMIRPVKPGGELEFKALYGYDYVAKGLTARYLSTGNVVATMNAVNQASDNPERAVMFLELLNTDPALYNLLAKGIEGTHWVWQDQANRVIGFPEGVTPETSGYNPNTDWMFGNQFNAYYIDASQVGTWEATKALNDEAAVSPALGFTFMTDSVETEIAQVQAVVKEYGSPINLGLVDPATAMPEYIARLKEAGVEKIIAEAQRQLDAWKATK